MTIFKYQLPPMVGTPGVVHLPEGARILDVAIQGHGSYLWAKVDPDAPLQVRRFALYPTGAHIPDSAIYLGTLHDNGFVWHVHELPELPR